MPSEPVDLLDLHDLATILLYEWSQYDPRFGHSRLIEVTDGSRPKVALPDHTSLPALDDLPGHGHTKAFFLVNDDDPHAPPIDAQSFKHGEFPSADPYSEYDIETAFWQVKHHDHGYALSHAMQAVLDNLPKNLKLRIRTSQGHSIIVAPSEFAIAEISVIPRQVMYICRIKKLPASGGRKYVSIDQYVSGTTGAIPWVYLVFGGNDVADSDPAVDRRVVLDLAAPFLCGMRGLGKEVFALEKMEHYHAQVLPLGGFEQSEQEIILSGRIGVGENRAEEGRLALTLASKVQSRVKGILEAGEKSCGYCGKRSPPSTCSRCKMAVFCNKRCQTLGWKYHKTWCKQKS